MRFLWLIATLLTLVACEVDPCKNCLTQGTIEDQYTGKMVQGVGFSVREYDGSMGISIQSKEIESESSDENGHFSMAYRRRRHKDEYRLMVSYQEALDQSAVSIEGQTLFTVIDNTVSGYSAPFPYDLFWMGGKVPPQGISLVTETQEVNLELVRYGGLVVKNTDSECGTLYNHMQLELSNAYGYAMKLALDCAPDSLWQRLPAGDWTLTWESFDGIDPVDTGSVQFHIAPAEYTTLELHP